MVDKTYIGSDDPSVRRLVVSEIKKQLVPDINVPVPTTQGSTMANQENGGITVVTNGIQTTTKTPDGTIVVLNTNKDVYVSTYEENLEQKYIKNGDSGTITVGYTSGSTFAGTVTSASSIGFEVADGFTVTQLSPGTAKIGLTGGVGTSGTSGYSGKASSGFSGVGGSPGQSGYSGAAGTNGSEGASGYSGAAGTNGLSGYSGADGSAGSSGYSGASGVQGISGFSGSGGGSVEIPLTEIAVGTGTGISGYSGFTYDMGKNAFHVNYPGAISNEFGEVVIRSADSISGYGHSQVYLTSALPAASSSIFIEAGDGGVDYSDGGNITIWTGNGYSGAPSGTLNLYAGDGGQEGGKINIEAGWALDDDPGTKAGDIIIKGGTAYPNVSTYDYSGNVYVVGGDNAEFNANTAGGFVVISSGLQSLTAFNNDQSGVIIKSKIRGHEIDGAGIVINAHGAIGWDEFNGDDPASLQMAVDNANYGQLGYYLQSRNKASPLWLAPIFKPAPMFSDPLSVTTIDFGSAAHHNNHWSSPLSVPVTINVKLDSYWTGTEEYWQNNGGPIDPTYMPDGGFAIFSKLGTGNVIISPELGVTIHTPNGLNISVAGGSATLRKIGLNEWVASGDLTP